MEEPGKELDASIQAYREKELPEKGQVVKIAKKLEKSLDINHFLNIKFNRENSVLYERLKKERDVKKRSTG